MICVEVHSNNVLALRSDTLSNAVSDSIKHETIKFLFPDNWNNYQKTAVFSAVGVEPINVLLCEESPLCLSKDECYIPFEVLKGDCFEVSVFGVLDETLATTTKEQIEVLQSGYTLGDQPSEPTQSEYSQILQMVIDTKQIAQSVRDDANNGVFKGEKGEKGDNGEEYSLTDADKAEIVKEVESKVEGLEADVETIKQGYVTLDYIENKYPDAQTVDRRIAEYDLTVQETYATKKYVDDAVASSGDTGDGVSKEYVDNAIDALADDVAYLSTHAATKQYVDDAVASNGGGTGGGGVSSWNDLTDKPFYDEKKTATLDYANPPEVRFNVNGIFLCKVIDNLLTADHINGANLSLSFTANGTVNNASQELNVDTLQVYPFSFGTGYLFECVTNITTFSVMIAVAEKTGEFDPFGDGNLINITETGTYIGCVPYDEATPNSMSLEYGSLKTLDIKFVPDELYDKLDDSFAKKDYVDDLFTSVGGNSGSVVTWKDIVNKPFNSEKKSAEVDYNNPPNINMTIGEATLYKVLDDALTPAQLEGNIFGAKISTSDAGQETVLGTLNFGGVDGNTAVNSSQFAFGTLYSFECSYETITNPTFYIAVVTRIGKFTVNNVTVNINETGTYLGLVSNVGNPTLSLIHYLDGVGVLDMQCIPEELYTEIDQRIENYISEALGGEY